MPKHVTVDNIAELAPAGELGSLEAYSSFATASSNSVPIPGTTIPVRIGTRPVKVTVTATLTAVQAAALAGVVIYEDATIIKTLHWTSPSAGSYVVVSATMRRHPAPGLHAYQAYLANFFANGNVGLFTVDPGNVGLEIVVEEI